MTIQADYQNILPLYTSDLEKPTLVAQVNSFMNNVYDIWTELNFDMSWASKYIVNPLKIFQKSNSKDSSKPNKSQRSKIPQVYKNKREFHKENFSFFNMVRIGGDKLSNIISPAAELSTYRLKKRMPGYGITGSRKGHRKILPLNAKDVPISNKV
ncbi:hypothetical protein HK099_000169 [Clydaea vesicula]|uniref:Uncharacterized protein n=1 Tax=Clydaea vesicula TaxID=447962 RepID=A0AAD5TVD9_9FUNG|nr:hypothetical protein HK099_000169 [Clydaea vesicula]KAJ3391811.1 hypothetical protein HDU92_008777 [Lobulomyces angularis]